MTRIAIAGFQHETNTFAPHPTDVKDFEMADSWPALLTGEAVIDQTKGMNLPIAGAAAEGGRAGADLIPILWCAAEPGGKVTDKAFDRFSAMIIDGLKNAGAIDALYLDLHGAMVTQSFQDGEGALLRRIRAEMGPDLPIGVSLDLHANISQAMVDLASVITIYRTYPHLDMADTGARCMERIHQIVQGTVFQPAFRQLPFLIPLHAQNTGQAPCDKLYADVMQWDRRGDFAELALGFTASDIFDCGPSVLTYASSRQQAEEINERLYQAVCGAERDFDTAMYHAEEAVRIAMNADALPVVLADVQDNPGAGASSDTTGILHAMIRKKAQGALLGVMHDPSLAAIAHAAGKGAEINGKLGGNSGLDGETAVNGPFIVEALSDGRITYTGEMYGGGVAEVGPSCVLRITQNNADIRVVVSSVRTQCLDLAFFTHFGIDPKAARMIAVKSTVHFRADFDPIAARTINVAAPGYFGCDLNSLSYQNLRNDVRLL